MNMLASLDDTMPVDELPMSEELLRRLREVGGL